MVHPSDPARTQTCVALPETASLDARECVQKLVHEILCQRREFLPDSRAHEHVANLVDNLFQDTDLDGAKLDKQKAHSRETLAAGGALEEYHAVENCADLRGISAHRLLSDFSLGTIPRAL